MKTGRRLPNNSSTVVEKLERTPMSSHEGWGRTLKMTPTLRNTEKLMMFAQVNSLPLPNQVKVTEN